MRLSGELMVAALTVSLLTGCGAPASSVPAAAGVATSARRATGAVPPACTVPKVKSGAMVTSVAAYGNFDRRRFSLFRAPSSWMEVEWLGTPPPGKQSVGLPATSRRSAARYNLYFGTYTVSDGTTGCFYLVAGDGGAPIAGDGNAAITALARIPSTGATLPHDFGAVKNLQVRLKNDDTGSGTMTLVHYDGSDALTGTIAVAGRVDF